MLNLIINLFWTITCVIPLSWYWGVHFAENRSPWDLIITIILSLLVYLIPNKWLNSLNLSKQRKTYEKFGLKTFRYFVQDGTLVNRLQNRKTNPRIIRNREQALKYLKTIGIQERFHYCFLVLFSLTTLCAFFAARPILGLFILLSNILYNVYPILLQQYNRLRIDNFSQRL